MKPLIVLFAALAFVSLSVSAHFLTAPALSRDGKTQPTDVRLNRTPCTTRSPDRNSVPFNHETHSLKNYSADLKSVPACTECHHTDQPKASLKAPYVTSEREEVLAAATLAKADQKPVKSCASCHSQAGTKPAGWPEIVTFTRANGDEVELTNENAYHINCIECHESVKKVKAATTAPIKCAECHSGPASPSDCPPARQLGSEERRPAESEERRPAESYEQFLEVRLNNAQRRFNERMNRLRGVRRVVNGQETTFYVAGEVRQVVAKTKSEILESLTSGEYEDESAALRDYINRYYPSAEPSPTAPPRPARSSSSAESPPVYANASHYPTAAQQGEFTAAVVHDITARVNALIDKVKKKKASVCIMSTSQPDGARFRFIAGGVLRREGDTDQRVANLYRGLYTYEIVREGYRLVRYELNLIDEDGDKIHCTLHRTGAGRCSLQMGAGSCRETN